MARMFLIIDGYNLMHAAGLGRSSYGPGGLERSRRRLLKQLASSLDQTVAADALVIFDAVQGVHGEPSPEELSASIKVRFSKAGLDADSEIELLLNSHSSPRQVLVVSGDHRLHKAARRRKARCMDSDDFWRLLESGNSAQSLPGSRRLPKPPSDFAGKPDAESSSEKSDFAQDFLKIDISEIQRSVRREDR